MSALPNIQYATPDPEYLALLSTLPAGEFPYDSVDASRQVLGVMLPVFKKQLEHELPDESKYTVIDHSVPVANGSAEFVVRTITPISSDPDQTFPVVYWMHGGGFIMGTVELADYKLRAFSVDLQITIALVEYRLAPEHRHPIPVNDCYDGLKWVVNNAPLLRADLAKGLIVAGESAGACLATIIAHRARDDPFFEGRKLTGQVVEMPCVIDPRAYPEQYKSQLRSLDSTGNQELTGLTPSFLRAIYEKHLQNSPDDPSASPLLYPSHADLPPALIQICGLDLLRDEGLLYEKVLREAGVKTKLIIYPGLPHGFQVSFVSLTATKKFYQDLKDGLVWLLAGGKN